MRTVLLVFSLNSLGEGHGRDAWFGPDKLQHFFTSAFVQSFGYAALRSTGVEHSAALAGASAATAAVGVGKELHDRRVRGDFSARDLAWDAAGAGGATVLLVRTAR
jgi:putative lipoprotein